MANLKHYNKSTTLIGSGSVKFRRYSEHILTPVETPSNYLTFNSPRAFSINVDNPGWNGTMIYSTNKKDWYIWDGNTVSSALNDDNHALYFSGISNNIVSGNARKYGWTINGSSITCSGNIETLLDYTTVASDEHPLMSSHCYAYMFSGCTSLIQAPELPANNLSTSCYNQMFSGCTSLTHAPALPATTLADFCYYNMFYNCTGLVQSPELPAITATLNCYARMFYGCEELSIIPILPATTLGTYCYNKMFYGCAKLKLSSIQTDEYTQEYRIPTSETGKLNGTSALGDMFTSTGGTFTGTPEINTTYYLHKDCSIVT